MRPRHVTRRRNPNANASGRIYDALIYLMNSPGSNQFLVPALASLLAAAGCHPDRSDCRETDADFATLCAATFDGTEKDLPVCPPGALGQSIVSCTDLNVIRYASAGGFDCIYDSATHQLVGGTAGTDIPTSCPGGYAKVAGRVPDASCYARSSVLFSCSAPPSDAGFD